jgi:hypothetical protein
MKILVAGLFLVLFAACGTGTKTEEKTFAEALDETSLNSTILTGEVNEILNRIPSPLEISVLLKESGKKYDAAFLNSPENVSKYNTNYKRALNLGIYGTDLGYTNIYEQTQDGVRYMSTIRNLANDLNIGQFFEMETIGRLVSNNNNLDSLLLITTQNFNAINHYLQSQDRSHLSVLFLTGGWLEALHITCQVAKLTPENHQLQETIGTQKIILDNLSHLLSMFKETDHNMGTLFTDLQDLKQAFDKVSITTIYKPSSFEIVDGVMVVKDNSVSTVEITQADIESIRTITQSIRTKVIS